MWRAAVVALSLVNAGCVVRQPESAKTVAAYEISLPTEAERQEFLALLQREAEPFDFHLDAAKPQELRDFAAAAPEFALTMNATVWQGDDDDEPVASAMDYHEHLGLIWIAFAKGQEPALATAFRERVVRGMIERWPATRALPVMPTGAIPLREDLCPTPEAYRVKISEASKYELPTSSPLAMEC